MTRSIFTAQYDRLCTILIQARVDAGMSQEQLAECLGRPQSFVSKFETKQRRLDVVEFLEVANCLRANGPELLARLTVGTTEKSGVSSMHRGSSRKPGNGGKGGDRTPAAAAKQLAKKNGKNGKNGG